MAMKKAMKKIKPKPFVMKKATKKAIKNMATTDRRDPVAYWTDYYYKTILPVEKAFKFGQDLARKMLAVAKKPPDARRRG